MSTDTTDELQTSIEIDAPPAQVWALVADLPRMREWSPQVKHTHVVGGRVRLGARMLNLNGQGWKRWPTTGKVVRCEPHRDLAFRITENTVVWSFGLEPLDDGARTRLTHRRETPDGVSAVSRGLTTVVLGGVPAFTEELRTGMQRTLAGIKATVEG